uniref:glycerate kinase n=1 Tax=Nocardia brasiliensis TaxID=37326 RepID=UPI002453E3C9
MFALKASVARATGGSNPNVSAQRPGGPREAKEAAGGHPGAGAAGGVGYTALAFLGASVRPGIELILELLSFTEQVQGARLVITG